MYQLIVSKRFAAAHRLVNCQGQCSKLHGHTWTVEVSVEGDNLDPNGMLVDFRILKSKIGQVIEEMDHSYLNEMPPFNQENCNPTAENLAAYIFQRLRSILAPELTLAEVRVWESPDACASYREEKRQ